jgi:uncharacterized protein YbjT (DUF2867 family)
VEEINGLGTLRLLRAAERAGAKRFLFFSALGATGFQRTRFFRSKALAERAVLDADLDGAAFAPSIVYDREDPWVTLLRRLALLPMLPVSGEGAALYQPIWAHDIARCVIGWLEGRGGSKVRHELAGPDVLSYDDIARTVAAAAGRPRPLLHIPLPLVRSGLIWLRRLVGENVFATWEEAELMEIPMTSRRGTADAEALGVEPLAMREALGGRS